jgi:Uma2 family endonuclease
MAVTQTRESSSPAPRGPFTYQHLRHLRDRLDERYRCEIINGELFVSPSPGLAHQRVAASLFLLLGNYVQARRLGEMLFAPLDVIFSDVDVVVPDLLYLTNEQLARTPDRGVEEAPTLVVEILSPSTQRRDRTKKMALYEEMGVPHYWLVHPTARWIEAYEQQAERFVLTARETGAAEFRPALFPGLVVPLGELWLPQGSRER